ncbi:MAG: Hpt domain-containing protein [Nitrospirae bacterium]|nr:Hpt domain-containing protein [Nitrospirota bacterium]
MTEDSGKIIVTIDNDLADLIPGYLVNRGDDIKKMNTAIESGEFEIIRTTGHQLKGSGGGYGFDFITATGMSIEQGAKDKDIVEIKRHIAALGDYLDRLTILYE